MSGFDHVTDWVFDLDNTLYPASCELFALIDARMTRFIMRALDCDATEAHRIQKLYYHAHGTTLAGLIAHQGVEPHAFLDEVHDIALDRLSPDPDLAAALARLPGRKVVFTNGSVPHAERVCAALGISEHISGVVDIVATQFIPKPDRRAFATMLDHFGITPTQAAMFEDLAKNLQPAFDLGMTTVLITPDDAPPAPFVHHVAPALTPFLTHLSRSLSHA